MDEERKPKVYRLNEERGPRFKGWMGETNVYRLDREKGPRFTGWTKKENQGLQVGWRKQCLLVGRRKRTKVYSLNEELEPKSTG